MVVVNCNHFQIGVYLSNAPFRFAQIAQLRYKAIGLANGRTNNSILLQAIDIGNQLPKVLIPTLKIYLFQYPLLPEFIFHGRTARILQTKVTYQLVYSSDILFVR